MRAVVSFILVFVGITSAALAEQLPAPGRLDNRVRSVIYQPNNVVQVTATYGISTMIIFDEDEKFQTISLGDTKSWQVVPTDKGNILFVKPVAKDVPTNMNVVTDKRIYYFSLKDQAPKKGHEVFGLRFIYPGKALNAKLRSEAEFRAANPAISNIDKANVNIDYSFSGGTGLKPLMVFDDGKHTFFKFSARVPAIFTVNSDFSETLTNFRKEGDYIVVDGTATQFTLRDGNDYTCIFNLRRPDFGAPDPSIMGPAHDPSAERRKEAK